MAYGQSLPAGVRGLLDFISRKESGGDYNKVYASKENTLDKPITRMTINELLAAQSVLGKRYGSSASGRYQHIRKTLLAQVNRLGISKAALFSAGLQDDLGWDLLRQRGLDAFFAGRMSRTAYGNNLAKEWASLPVLSPINGKKRGQSYYAGDGLNASHVTPEDFEAALNAAFAAHKKAGAAAQKAARVVDDAAAEDRVSTTEVVSGLGGVGATAKAVQETVTSVSDGTNALIAAGPWVLLLIVAAGFAFYVWRERRRKKKDAREVKQMVRDAA